MKRTNSGRRMILLLAVLLSLPLAAQVEKAPRATPRQTLPLSTWIEQTLKNNPRIRVAQAAILEAEARLQEAKSAAVRDIIDLYYREKTLTGTIDELEPLVTEGLEAKRVLSEALADRARLRGQIDYHLGREMSVPEEEKPTDTWWGNYVKSLERLCVSLSAEELPVKVVLDSLAKVSGQNLIVPDVGVDLDATLTFQLKDVPLKAAMTLIAHMIECKFVAIENDNPSMMILRVTPNAEVPEGARTIP